MHVVVVRPIMDARRLRSRQPPVLRFLSEPLAPSCHSPPNEPQVSLTSQAFALLEWMHWAVPTLRILKAPPEVLWKRKTATSPEQAPSSTGVPTYMHFPLDPFFSMKLSDADPPPSEPAPVSPGTVGGDPYYTGNVRCSIGFSVHGGFVTAGHCGRAGAGVSGWDRSYIGTFQGSSFPDNDYAWVSVGSGWWTVPVVLGWGTVSDQLVRGSNVAPVGASICRSGSTTHWHCGTVLAHNETVNYSDGSVVHQLTKTSVCAEGGDSGGSFISGDQAQGVTSGGWGNCSSGGETWFQPVNEILNRYGLTLHTA